MLLLLGMALAAPASAQAAFVTAVDVSVRPAEGSPWSKGTLFRGEGFSVGATTGNGWAWGRAGGEADRCGWVLISEINSTTRTDSQCGSPKTEPLEDSEHVPGGGASERWYVTCESATLFGNYGGAAGVLRSPAGSASRGAAVGWRYTTGNGYAASIDGPTGTPRFILRSCISRTPPSGAPPGGPPPAESFPVGPPPYRLLDEDQIFSIFGPIPLVSSSAFASAGKPRVRRSRATIRLNPSNIVLANGLRGDPFTSSGIHCKGWVRGTITRGTRPFEGWVQASALTRAPRRKKRDCNATVRYDDRIGFVNAPFRSVTFRHTKKITRGKKKRKVYEGNWTTTGSASEVRLKRDATDKTLLASECSTLYMNYVPAEAPEKRFQDPVIGRRAKELFLKGDLSSMKGKVGYRYTTTGDRDAAMVSVPTGFMRAPSKRSGSRRPKPTPVSLWAFVRRDCVRTPRETNPASKITSLYFSEIRICDGLKPSDAVKRLNKSTSRAKRFAAIRPCRLPNAATQPGQPRPDHQEDGWNAGSVRRP